ncbi:zinc finger protein ZAT9-like [Impatiens glandulifera]|uniref:zinc finger protein ZAT9-like n=1 Tax=Impatiens glandulifera TaxID=253017 RepID=UPI001FB19D0A|nr:zinc finger protein ZAT9-like [Impatiens glandulifera]
MAVKRGRDEVGGGGEVETMAMANCLMLLSQVGEKALSGDRVFTCKTCNRQFHSFQALGGHRASHNRLKQTPDRVEATTTTHHDHDDIAIALVPVKHKTHACTICGDEFPIGQALGGHMRRHRTTNKRAGGESTETGGDKKRAIMRMDLNLTPFENCVKFGSSVLVGILNNLINYFKLSMMKLKRGREEDEVEALAMANCLMLLSHVGEKGFSDGRVFTCKTCHRQFPTFQALGGHRASHGKPKQTTATEEEEMINSNNNLGKKKIHECSVCGKNFPTGQSLGGHMRRHRGTAVKELTAAAEKEKEDDRKRIMRMRVDLNLTPLQNYLKLGKTSFVMGLV